MVYDINNSRQNHPELIVCDLQKYIEPNIARFILKDRGVNKWLRVRRLLIQLKCKWREQIKELQETKHKAKSQNDLKTYYKLQGYVEALIDCRQQVRALCHSPRDIDFPQTTDFPASCELPPNFPVRPHKRWFGRNDKITQL